MPFPIITIYLHLSLLSLEPWHHIISRPSGVDRWDYIMLCISLVLTTGMLCPRQSRLKTWMAQEKIMIDVSVCVLCI